jgi:hypothetical protein
MKNYTREFVIQRLQENGLKPVYNKDGKGIKYFQKPKSKYVGIKNLGYLDFLNLKAI